MNKQYKKNLDNMLGNILLLKYTRFYFILSEHNVYMHFKSLIK